MSFTFPEKPMLVYPSLARQIGVEPALLLGLYHEALERDGISDARGSRELLLSRSQWLALTPFWEEDRLRQLSEQLVAAGLLEIRWGSAGNLRLRLAKAKQPTAESRPAEPGSTLAGGG